MQTEVIFNYKKTSKKLYLNEFIEKNSKLLKKIFLESLKNIEKKKIFKNKNLRDLFKYDNSFNLWELSHLYEKNIFKEDCINICLQYLAIIEIIKNHDLQEITLNNIDAETIKVLRKYRKKIKINVINKNKKKIYDHFRNFILGNWITSLIFFLKGNLISSLKKKPLINVNKNLIISYFCHYKKDFYKRNFFVSDHWQGLENIIKKNFFYLNLFIASKDYKNYALLKKKVNRDIINLEDRNFLHNYFSFHDLLKVVFFTLFYSCKFFLINLIIISKNDNKFELLELTYKIQKRSFSGITSFENFKNFYCFKSFLNCTPNIERCIYLMENHSWEKILLKLCHQKKIITYGYIHATMPFWHLNYYQTRISNLNNENLPNKILTVSKINEKLLINQGIVKKKICLVEALRYDWLNKVKIFDLKNKKIKKILVFGDYEKKINQKLLEVIQKFSTNKNIQIYFKPHPGDLNKYSNKKYKFKIVSVFPKVMKFNFYIFSNSTSASAEYSHLSNNIAIFQPKFSINLSPFKDLENYKNIFFSDEAELLNIIDLKTKNKFDGFFYLNEKHIKWKKKINEEFL